MDGWSQFGVDTVMAAMPTDMEVLHSAWVDANPTKATRRAEIVAAVRERFRAVMRAAPHVVMDEDPNTVPTSGLDYAVDTVIFRLGMEMGVKFAPEVTALMTRIDVWLRMVASGATSALPQVDTGTPSYVGRDPCERNL